MQNFRNLKVWQKSHSLALHVYAKTADGEIPDQPVAQRSVLVDEQDRRRRAAIWKHIAVQPVPPCRYPPGCSAQESRVSEA